MQISNNQLRIESGDSEQSLERRNNCPLTSFVVVVNDIIVRNSSFTELALQFLTAHAHHAPASSPTPFLVYALLDRRNVCGVCRCRKRRQRSSLSYDEWTRSRDEIDTQIQWHILFAALLAGL